MPSTPAPPAESWRCSSPWDVLTPFGVEFRYPDESELVSREEAEPAVGLPAQGLQAIDHHLAPYLAAGRPSA
jgi:hypothetical protein